MRVTPPDLAPPSSDVAAIQRCNTHLDAFVVGKGRIGSFRDLPLLLKEANALGTNVLYLIDYWEGSDEGGDAPYFNKGDYLPRADLGGESAFIEGIRAVQQQGGRVLAYLEPFIIYAHSQIALSHGLEWAGRDPHGQLYRDYPGNYSMVAPFRPWQDYLVDVAKRLVGQYGVDGVFLDSYAWQMNRPMQTQQEGRLYSPQEYSQGVLQLTERVRAAIRELKPDAVVLGETTAGPIARHWDGGLDADFAWLRPTNQGRITASQVRYGIPEICIFGNGVDLNELHQVYAAGHGLALCNYWPGSFMYKFGAHIRKLVEIRRLYKNALIYGIQKYQPGSRNPAVAAYYYESKPNHMITLVNTASTDQSIDILLRPDDHDSVWRDLLTGQEFSASGILLEAVPLSVGIASLRVLLRLP
jgi:hypothetical protein